MSDSVPTPPAHRGPSFNIIVLISGRGSNLRAIVSAINEGRLAANIQAVISNNADAAGLDYAKTQQLETHVLDHKAYKDRLSFDRAMIERIDSYTPDLIVLAGFMRLLTADFVTHYLGKLINIHPSLLPAYRGLHTHQRALADKVSVHGASIHFVTPELDSGPVIAQCRVPVFADDSIETLTERVLATEHILYPTVIAWFTQGRIKMLNNTTAILDGKVISEPVLIS